MSDPVYLYRWYAADSSLLYIGISRHPRARGHKHLRESAWARWAQRIDIQEPAYSNEAEAKAAEKIAIQTEHPRFNRAHGTAGYGPQFRARGDDLPSATWTTPEEILGPREPLPPRSQRLLRTFPLAVPCPGCGVATDAPCMRIKGPRRVTTPHQVRLMAARETGHAEWAV